MVIAVDPKIDYVFKCLFGSTELSALLVNLINAVLGLTGDGAVQQVEILNPFVPGELLNPAWFRVIFGEAKSPCFVAFAFACA